MKTINRTIAAGLLLGSLAINGLFAQSALPLPPITSKPSRAEQLTAGTLSHNVPISFYAQVVDQNTMPVSGAKVRLKYREYLLVAPNVPAENNQP
jgi:hypothetical protein